MKLNRNSVYCNILACSIGNFVERTLQNRVRKRFSCLQCVCSVLNPIKGQRVVYAQLFHDNPPGVILHMTNGKFVELD